MPFEAKVALKKQTVRTENNMNPSKGASRFQELADNSPRVLMQMQKMETILGASTTPPPTMEGLPSNIRSKLEGGSGLDMSDVRVYKNSPEPAKYGALAFTKGAHIHLGTGQEEHLSHELGHVIQQKRGGVDATTQINGQWMNDDPAMEREADLLGVHGGHQGEVFDGNESLNYGNVIQAKRSDDYKGGAELEFREGKAEVEVEDIPNHVNKDMIREGLKGLDIESIGAENKILTGENWALTIETVSGTTIDEHNKIKVELELILGGPKGSKLTDLEKAADDAAKALKALDQEGIFNFNEPEKKLRQAYEEKKKKKHEAKKKIPNADFGQAEAESAPWDGLKLKCSWSHEGNSPVSKAWGLQITLGIPLEDIQTIGTFLTENENMADPSKPYIDSGKDVSLTSKDILENLPDTAFASPPEVIEKMPSLSLVKQKSMRYVSSFDNADIDRAVAERELEEANSKLENEQAADLWEKWNQRVKKETDLEAPSKNVLDGLARVLAAYLRGLGNSPADGPKHNMKLVNKNPLPAIIKNVCRAVEGQCYEHLKTACMVTMTKHGKGKKYYWNDQKELKLEDWAKEVIKENKDLVAVYDAAYRSGQIGGLAELNKIGQTDEEVPVIEFRDLGDIKPSEMSELLNRLISVIDNKYNAQPAADLQNGQDPNSAE